MKTMNEDEDVDIYDALNDFLELRKKIEILKAELRQQKSEAKTKLNDLIEDGERLGIEENLIELLKSMKHG